jgi:hypothetical protein
VRHAVVSPVTAVGVVVVAGGGGGGGVNSVRLTASNMGVSWRRRGVSQTSILACVILFIVVVVLVIEARPGKGARHRVSNGSPGKRRVTNAERSPHHSRQHRNGRTVHLNQAVHLKQAVNLTLCPYTVHNDIVEDRVPKAIRHVTCVKNGCRCRVVNNTGTYLCTQLIDRMLVTINSKQESYDVPYACVCASKYGDPVPEPSSPMIVK